MAFSHQAGRINKPGHLYSIVPSCFIPPVIHYEVFNWVKMSHENVKQNKNVAADGPYKVLDLPASSSNTDIRSRYQDFSPSTAGLGSYIDSAWSCVHTIENGPLRGMLSTHKI